MFKEGSQFLCRLLRLVKSALLPEVLSQHPAKERGAETVNHGCSDPIKHASIALDACPR